MKAMAKKTIQIREFIASSFLQHRTGINHTRIAGLAAMRSAGILEGRGVEGTNGLQERAVTRANYNRRSQSLRNSVSVNGELSR
jgi:hypothetical protein